MSNIKHARALTLAIAAVACLATLPSFAAEPADAPVPTRGSVISSSPVMPAMEDKTNAPAAGAVSDLVLGKPAPVTAASEQEAPGSVAWVLSSEQRPWPLRYRDLTFTGVVYLSVPDLQEARLMLPGLALDGASRARQQLTKYITDAIGVAAQDRARQIEALTAWVDRTTKQKASVSLTDDWARYAFYREVIGEITPYREKLANQSEPEIKKYIEELTKVVAQVTPVMNAMQGYEQRTAWYNLMVQFKEGLQLIQAQQRTGDAQALKVIDEFLDANPVVARPAGDTPKRTASGTRAVPAVEAPTLTTVEALDVRKPAEAPAEVPPKEGNGFLGMLIALVIVGGVLSFFIIPLRKRMKRKAPAAAE